MTESATDRWTGAATKVLVGRKVVAVRYMTTEEAEAHGWVSRPLVIQLDNGLIVYPSRDDEGNDGGALFTNDNGLDTIPVIRDY